MTLSATVVTAHRDSANAALAAEGYGPNNFSVALNQGAATTHYGLHAWHDPGFLSALQSLTVPSLRLLSEPGRHIGWRRHLDNEGLQGQAILRNRPT